MISMRILFAALLPAAALFTALAADAQGLPAEWETRKGVETLKAKVERLKAPLDQVRPKEWVAKGAPEAYVGQWERAKSHAEGVKLSADELGRNPEKLTAVLDTYFRVAALESSILSLAEGVSRYQNPALADLLKELAQAMEPDHHQLHQFILDLASQKEADLKVMDQEAQRCRGFLSKQPVIPPKPAAKAGDK